VKPGKKNSWWKRILIRLSKVAALPWTIRSITEKEYAKIGELNNSSAQFIALPFDPEKDAALRSIVPRGMFENFVQVPFEGSEFMAIADYDQWLTGMYGDYMTPPANKNRTSPHTLSNIYWI
jgi:lipopolysaccharide cholinephosphotransferase